MEAPGYDNRAPAETLLGPAADRELSVLRGSMRGMVFCDLCEMDLAFCIHGMTPKATIDTFGEARQRFPGADTVNAERLARVDRLKTEFLLRHPEPEPDVGPYWAKCQQVFSDAGLAFKADR